MYYYNNQVVQGEELVKLADDGDYFVYQSRFKPIEGTIIQSGKLLVCEIVDSKIKVHSSLNPPVSLVVDYEYESI